MNKLEILKELESLDIVEEFFHCALWLSKYIKDFKNDKALEKAYGIWEKNMALRHWIRKNTLKPQYQLWIGKNVRASEDMPPKDSQVVFTKEKDAYTWSSSKRYAVSCTQTDNDKIKGSYLLKVFTSKDEVIFDLYSLSRLQFTDEELTQLVEAGFSQRTASLLKDTLEELSKDSFKEIIICTDVVNRGQVSAVLPKGGNIDGNWRFR